MSYFIWDDIKSREFGILQHPPVPQTAMENYEYTSIPNHLPIAKHLYTRNTISISCTLQIKEFLQYNDVFAWLDSGNKQGILIISNDLEKYYRATCTEVKATEMSLRFSSIEITFTCLPFRYAVDNTPITLTSADTINVKGNYYCEPKITLYGTGSGILTVNNTSISVGLSEYLTIDSDRMLAYKDNTVAISQTAGEFPVLQTGDNSVSWSGNIHSVEITKNERWL